MSKFSYRIYPFLLILGTLFFVPLIFGAASLGHLLKQEWHIAAYTIRSSGMMSSLKLIDWRTSLTYPLTAQNFYPPLTSNKNAIYAVIPDGIAMLEIGHGTIPKTIYRSDGLHSTLFIDVSPDGQQIGLTSGTLQIVDLRTGSFRVPLPDYLITEFRWSPDGQTILFAGRVASDPISTSDLYLLDLQNGTVISLNLDSNRKSSPVWSPDGTQIGFNEDRGFYIANKDGSHLSKITGYSLQFPLWSRDGTHLYFYNEFEKTLYRINAVSGRTTRLGQFLSTDEILSLAFQE